MARRRRGFQEGIDVPTTLGAPLTSWSDPTPTPTSRFDMSVPNTGAQRNYGATGEYVDTVPHRWKVGKPTFDGKQLGQLAQSRAQDRTSAADLGISPRELRARRTTARATGARDARLSRDRALFDTTAEDDLRRSATDLGVTPEELTTWRREDAETRRREEVLSRDRDIAMRRPPSGPAIGGTPPPPAFPSPTGTGTPPAGPTTGGVPAPPGFPAPTPSAVRTGRPVPPPPPSGGAPTAPTGAPPLDMPPMPPRRATDAPWMTREPDISTAGDPFMEALRRAPDTPLESPVEGEEGSDRLPRSPEYRDDPSMTPLGLPGGAGDKALESWLRGGGDGSSRTPASKPPSSRTKRRPRRPNA